MPSSSLIVAGAGIVGLWQALTLRRRGHRVQLIDSSPEPFAAAASRLGGAMLAPYCEAEPDTPVVRDLGLRALALWRSTYPGTVQHGTLVVAAARDRSELDRFARLTQGHMRLDARSVAGREPDLDGRFQSGLYYADEAHVIPADALAFLLEACRSAGVEVAFGASLSDRVRAGAERIIDCRGLGARHELDDLRGVRGERLLLRTDEVTLQRPVRLLHPRHPLYVVPWRDGLFMVGATVIESEDAGPVTVRSALELLGTAYALHPAFGEAQIVDASAGVRPAFADNVPKIVVRGDAIHVNGLYRHGYLLAPALAELVADYLETGAVDARVFVPEPR